MDEAILDAQQTLVDRIDDAGWDVTDAELSVYESPWTDDDAPEVTVTLTARRRFPDAEAPTGRTPDEDGDDDSPFRI